MNENRIPKEKLIVENIVIFFNGIENSNINEIRGEKFEEIYKKYYAKLKFYISIALDKEALQKYSTEHNNFIVVAIINKNKNDEACQKTVEELSKNKIVNVMLVKPNTNIYRAVSKGITDAINTKYSF